MDDADGVGGGQRIGRLGQVIEQPLERRAPRGQDFAQVVPWTSSMAMNRTVAPATRPSPTS